MSEDQAREILVRECECRGESLTAADIRDDTCKLLWPSIAIAAIQQAVSECSGGGVEEITTAMYEAGKQASAQWGPLGNWLGRYQLAPIYKAMRRAALPLPPSPVKESRDAALDIAADVVDARWPDLSIGDVIRALKSTPHQGGEGK